MESTTEYLDALLDTTTVTAATTALDSTSLLPLLSSAAAILSDDHGSTKILTTHNVPHQDTHQITFEVPSHRDLERIQHLDTFNTLMRRLGSTVYKMSTSGDHHQLNGASSVAITNDQISKSVVLDMADPKNSGASGFERFFQGADMHAIINYLWIGVVTSLIILSVIFILFSFYFYRKFREWKKCNKDIRAHLNNDSYHCGSLVTPCDALLSPPHHSAADLAYFQKESQPPCYTIATGLPTYDEALRVNFSYGMNSVMYPSLAMYQQQHQPVDTSKWNVKHGMAIKTKSYQQQQQHKLMHQTIQLQQCKSAATVFSGSLPFVPPPAYSSPEACAAESGGSEPLKDVCIDLSECSRNAQTSEATTETAQHKINEATNKNESIAAAATVVVVA